MYMCVCGGGGFTDRNREADRVNAENAQRQRERGDRKEREGGRGRSGARQTDTGCWKAGKKEKDKTEVRIKTR